MKINVASLSGGKDSTAMVIRAKETGLHFHEYVFCDTGVEFPEMYTHLEKLELYLGQKIIRMRSPKSFEFLMLEFKKKNGQIGYSWPDFSIRWCTQRMKKDEFKKARTIIKRKYGCKKTDIIEFHGIALDEEERSEKNKEKVVKYPLIDWEMTEKDCLQYCYSKGFDWSGLYEKFDRVSCWCCPLSNKKELAILKRDYPELWSRMLSWEKRTWRTFKPGKNLSDF
jgi:3'-phosphoadenosine 5'-phosphosulfate sulfotransferase (PAPS reductase)/FAD synthetase